MALPGLIRHSPSGNLREIGRYCVIRGERQHEPPTISDDGRIILASRLGPDVPSMPARGSTTVRFLSGIIQEVTEAVRSFATLA
jgi:hypothetical protein